MIHHGKSRIWRWRVALAASGLALITTHHGGAATPAAVSIEHFAFLPPALTVLVGTTVTWTNHDEDAHTVTSTAFSSAGLSSEETFSQTFTRPGTYEYHCALHPQMRATVVVN